MKPDRFAEPGARPVDPPSRTCRITAIELHLELDFATGGFAGSARLHLAALPSFQGRWGFDLRDMDEVAITAGGVALQAIPVERGFAFDGQLPDVVAVHWRCARPVRGLYFTGPRPWCPDRPQMAWTQCQDEDAHAIFPCHDQPGCRVPITLTVGAPAHLRVLSNGAVMDATRQGDRAITRFAPTEPLPVYLFSVVVGDFVEHPAFHGDLPVRTYLGRHHQGDVGLATGRTPEMIAFIEGLTGQPYPWRAYDQVIVDDFVFGGMENTGISTMTDLLLVDALAVPDWPPDALVVHELAHQWFGDLVTCVSWDQGWLNESWATIIESFWWRATRPADEATWYRYETARAYFDDAAGRYIRAIDDARFRNPIDVFDTHLYQKGGIVLWTLMIHIGESAFWSGVRRYLAVHRHGSVHTRDFQAALEEETGLSLGRFFRTWISRRGHPTVDVTVALEKLGVAITFRQTHEGDEAHPFSMPIEVVTDGITTRRLVAVDGDVVMTFIPTTSPVTAVRVDPGFNVLAHVSLKGPEALWITGLRDACPVFALRCAEALLNVDSPLGHRAVEGAATSAALPALRGSLYDALGRRGGPQVRDVLVAAAAHETAPAALKGLARALGRFREPEAASALLDLAARVDLGSWGARAAVLTALGATRDLRATPVLIAALETPSWAESIRRGALMGLGNLGDPAHKDLLWQWLGEDRPDRLRSAAAMALGTWSIAQPEHRRDFAERLGRALAGAPFRVALGVVEGLALVGHPAGLPALTSAHASHSDGRIQRMAFEAMRRIREANDDPNTGVRERLDALSAAADRLRDRLVRVEALAGSP